MLLEQILTEKKVVNVKSSTYPRNALVALAIADMKDDLTDFEKEKLRGKFRGMVLHVIRKEQQLWTLDTGKVLYKMVTPKEIE